MIFMFEEGTTKWLHKKSLLSNSSNLVSFFLSQKSSCTTSGPDKYLERNSYHHDLWFDIPKTCSLFSFFNPTEDDGREKRQERLMIFTYIEVVWVCFGFEKYNQTGIGGQWLVNIHGFSSVSLKRGHSSLMGRNFTFFNTLLGNAVKNF